MREIQSLPSSVQALLDEGKSLIARADNCDRTGYPEAAENLRRQGVNALGEATKILAQSDPQLAGLIILTAMGNKGFELTETRNTVTTVRTDKYCLGIRTGRDEKTTTVQSTQSRSLKRI